MAARPDPERLELWRALDGAQRAIATRLDRALRTERDLPLAWFEALQHLHDAGGRLRAQDLATALVIPRSTLTRLLDRLQTAGLVAREATDDDGRGTVVAITGEGRTVRSHAFGVYQREVHDAFAAWLTDSDVIALHRVVGKLDPA